MLWGHERLHKLLEITLICILYFICIDTTTYTAELVVFWLKTTRSPKASLIAWWPSRHMWSDQIYVAVEQYGAYWGTVQNCFISNQLRSSNHYAFYWSFVHDLIDLFKENSEHSHVYIGNANGSISCHGMAPVARLHTYRVVAYIWRTGGSINMTISDSANHSVHN